MMKSKCLIILAMCLIINNLSAQKDSALVVEDNFLFEYKAKTKLGDYLLSSGEVVAINAFVNVFDRYILQADFAEISLQSIKDNIDYGFVWDNDKFSTNLFAHPYHGSLYFNSARSNGLNFWQSAPFSFCGSLMWEIAGEIEPPAINDLMATTMGGISLGEITFRLSNLILDDSSVGWERFFREFFSAAICPIKGLNRLLDKKAWRVNNQNYLYHDFDKLPVVLSLSVGTRYLADNGSILKGEYSPYLQLFVKYGEPYNLDNNAPYDYFTAQTTVELSSNQPIFSSVNVLGRLWGKNIVTNTSMKAQFGLFQNFNYYNSEPVIDNSSQVPYRISEAASVGSGFMYSFDSIGSLKRLEQRIFANIILLGGSISDYYHYIDRDYNMGSGYSFRVNTTVQMTNTNQFILNAEYYTIYTWKGYNNKNTEDINPLYLNAQGDKSVASLFVVNPLLRLHIKDNFSCDISLAYYLRKTDYKYHKDVVSNTFDFKLGLNYILDL